MARSHVAVNAQGRITLPAAARRRLGLTDGARLEVNVVDDEIRLRPARLVVAEDAWAYTAETLSAVRQGLRDIAEGRVQAMSADEIARWRPSPASRRKR